MIANNGEQGWKITISGSGVVHSCSIKIFNVPDCYQKWMTALKNVELVDGRQAQDIDKFTLKWPKEALVIDSEYHPLDAHKLLSDPNAKTLQLVIEECDVLREGGRNKKKVENEDQLDGAIPIHSLLPCKQIVTQVKNEPNEGKSDASNHANTKDLTRVATQGEKKTKETTTNTFRIITMVIVFAVIGVAVAKVRGQQKPLESEKSLLDFECGMLGSIKDNGSCRCMKGLTMETMNEESACYANVASLFTEGAEKLWNFQKKQLKCCIVRGDPAATRLQDMKGEIPPSDRLWVLDKFKCGSMFGKNYENGPKRHTECLISMDSLVETTGKGFQEIMALLDLEVEK